MLQTTRGLTAYCIVTSPLILSPFRATVWETVEGAAMEALSLGTHHPTIMVCEVETSLPWRWKLPTLRGHRYNTTKPIWVLPWRQDPYLPGTCWLV